MYPQVTAVVLRPGHVEEGINIFRDSATLKGFEKPVRLHEVRWQA